MAPPCAVDCSRRSSPLDGGGLCGDGGEDDDEGGGRRVPLPRMRPVPRALLTAPRPRRAPRARRSGLAGPRLRRRRERDDDGNGDRAAATLPSARGPVLSRARAAECVLELNLCALSARRTAPPGGAIAAIGETDRTSDRLPTGTSASAPFLDTTAEPNLNEEAGVGQYPGGRDFGIQKKRWPRHETWDDGRGYWIS